MECDHPVTVIPARAQHIREIIRLERSCSTAAHWSEQQYFDLLSDESSPRLVLVAEMASEHPLISPDDPVLLGFLVAHHLAMEWELENIVVAPEARGKGVGTRLMEEFLAHAKRTNSEFVFLEVRESNSSARGLYNKLDFQETGRRKSYYMNPLEDAVLYCKNLQA